MPCRVQGRRPSDGEALTPTVQDVAESPQRASEAIRRAFRSVGKVSYQLQLPPRLKIHPVFHASLLKPYHGDAGDPSRGKSRRAPTAVVTASDKDVEYILADRVIRRRGIPAYNEYLMKWKNLPESETTWESENDLWQFAAICGTCTALQAQQHDEDATDLGGGGLSRAVKNSTIGG